MDFSFSSASLWWLLAGAAVVVELASGSFYLLMIAIGFVAAALVSYLGIGFQAEIFSAALIGGGAVFFLYRKRQRPSGTPLSLDINAWVEVEHWQDNHRSRVKYRGALWDAQLESTPTTPPAPGRYPIAAIDGNTLVLKNTSAPAPTNFTA